MAFLSASELKRLERKHAEGIRATEAVRVFRDKGERFSAATLRKYVQLGLLPKSRRVGERGRHKGSSGIYPSRIFRQINEIKRALDAGATLEEVRNGSVGLSGEVDSLLSLSDATFTRFTEALQVRHKTHRGTLKRTLTKHRRALEREIRALNRLADRM